MPLNTLISRASAVFHRNTEKVPPNVLGEDVSHLLDLRDTRFGYKHGFLNKDDAMLLACFKILTDFVEKDRPFDDDAWGEEGSEQSAAEITIKELYDWWTAHRPVEHAKMKALSHDPMIAISDQFKQLKQELYAKDQSMLLKLVGVREYLWT